MKKLTKASPAVAQSARCSVEPLETRLLLSTVSWIGTSSGAWSNTNNWSSHALPQSGDDVLIAANSTALTVTLSANTTVHSLSLTGDTLNVTGATLSLSANSAVNSGAVNIAGNGAISLPSAVNFSNAGLIDVNAGSQLLVGGTFTQASGGSLLLPNGVAGGSGVGTNLLGNPGFESPAAGSTAQTPYIWGQWGSTYVSTAYAHSGAQSLIESGANSGIQQSFAVSPGVSYSANAWALDPSIEPLSGSQGLFMNISFVDANGNSISTGSQFLTLVSSTSANDIWVNTSTTTTAPAGAARVNLYFQIGPYTGHSGTAGGAAFLDDVAFGPSALLGGKATAAAISNSGSFSIGDAAVVTATGSFTQTSTGAVNFLLAGPPAGNSTGTLAVGGNAALGGALQATLSNGYTPALSDAFTLMTYASETGSFASYSLPTGGSYAFVSGINPTYAGISAIAPAPTTTINAGIQTKSASNNLVGVNIDWWDNLLSTTQTQQMVEAAGISIYRFPGGSSSDDYHFNKSNNYTPGEDTIPQFAQFITSVGGLGIATTDYGSGSPQEAEAELAYLEGSTTDTTVIGTGIEWSDAAGAWQNVNWQTVGYWASLRAATPLANDDGYNFLRIGKTNPFIDIPYWEIGNEEYGSWEIDHHGTAGPGGVSTGSKRDPATYAAFAAAFASFDANDPNLPKVSVGIDSGDPTGAGDNNWTKNVLTFGYADGFVPGFISDHNYVQGPGQENDSFLLNNTVSSATSTLGWATRASDYEAMLQQTVGSANAAGVKLMATEYNSNYGTEGKQMTSLVEGIFIADSVGSLLSSGYSAGLVWDLRNGWNTTGNNSPLLYGWRQGGDEGLLGTSGLNQPPATGPYVPYASYFGEQLASKIMQSGGVEVSSSSNYGELTVYSVLEPNGHLELMVLNKNPDATINEQFNLSGFSPTGQAQIWQYGEVQDDAQENSSTGASALANFNTSLALTVGNFTYSFPSYSMTVIDLTPTLSLATAAAAAPTPTILGNPVALSALGAENGKDTNLTYLWSWTGPTGVTYSGATNGTNAAKNITANFTQPGIYNFSVIITDPSSQTVTSNAQVTLLPVFASQSSSTLNVNLNSMGAISVTASGGNITVTEDAYPLVFSGISAININGSATSNIVTLSGLTAATPVSFANDATSTVYVNNGTVDLSAAPAISLSSLNISGNASVVLAHAVGSESQLVLGALSIFTGGSLDLADNTLLINYGAGLDPIASISGWITSGFNGVAWNGTGIFSSVAAANSGSYGIGYADSADPGNPAGLASNQVEVMYTLLGDANLDGKVNGADFAILSTNFNGAVPGWDAGDFNYDFKANGADFALLAGNFNKGVSLPAVAAAVQTTPAVAATASVQPATTADVTPAKKHKSHHSTRN
jgi:hypothetical protein